MRTTRRISAKIRPLLERDKGICFWCEGDTREDGVGIPTRDHLTPQSLGGGWEMPNLVLACGDCNEARACADASAWNFLTAFVLNADPEIPFPEVGIVARVAARGFFQNLSRLGS